MMLLQKPQTCTAAYENIILSGKYTGYKLFGSISHMLFNRSTQTEPGPMSEGVYEGVGGTGIAQERATTWAQGHPLELG